MDDKLMKELRQIRNLLIVIALKLDATTVEVGTATGIGASNVSALVPQRPRKVGKARAKGRK